MTHLHTPVGQLDTSDGAGSRTELLSTAYVVDDAALTGNPAQVLQAVERARAEHRTVAVDGVGSASQTLSLLPLVEPDIIVLAPELSDKVTDAAAARALHVLAAQAERTGAVIIARGVDTEVHRTRALALGATLGIGELFASPHAPTRARVDRNMGPTWSTPSCDLDSPFAIASRQQQVSISTKKLLVEMSIQVEASATTAGSETLALGTFQHSHHFGTSARRRWKAMARRIAYTGVCGVDMHGLSDDRITRHALAPDDTLVDEWNVVVLGQFYCCVLSARDLHLGESELDRKFEYVVSHDRGTVVRCARTILSRFDGPVASPV